MWFLISSSFRQHIRYFWNYYTKWKRITATFKLKKEWRKIIRTISLKLKLNRIDIHPHFPPLDIIFQVDGLKVLFLKLQPEKLER